MWRPEAVDRSPSMTISTPSGFGNLFTFSRRPADGSRSRRVPRDDAAKTKPVALQFVTHIAERGGASITSVLAVACNVSSIKTRESGRVAGDWFGGGFYAALDADAILSSERVRLVTSNASSPSESAPPSPSTCASSAPSPPSPAASSSPPPTPPTWRPRRRRRASPPRVNAPSSPSPRANLIDRQPPKTHRGGPRGGWKRFGAVRVERVPSPRRGR